MARAVVPVLALALCVFQAACAANGMDPGDVECDGKCDGAGSREGSLRENLLYNLRDVMRSGQVLFGQERFPLIGVDGSGSTWTSTDV